MLACGRGHAINNVFEPESLRMATTKMESEDDNDSKADDYDKDSEDDNETCTVAIIWRIAGAVAMLRIY